MFRNGLKGFVPSEEDELSRRDAELYVVARIWSHGEPLAVPITSRYKCFPIGASIKFKEWLTFPIKYRDLSPTSRLVLTVYNVSSGEPVIVGGTCLPMFNKKGVLKLGR